MQRIHMRHAVEKSIGPLKSLVLEGKPNTDTCIILFHGYGADASDLVPLADMMGIPNATWIFPDAPMEVIIAPGIYGKAWFQIDQRRLENALVSGQPLDMSSVTPNGFEAAAKMALGLFENVRSKYKKVFVGGFSQGAMLATEVALLSKNKPDGLIIYSGTLINKPRWEKLAKDAVGVPFFQSHGKNDALLGYEYAENLFNTLTDAGMNGDFFSFSGGHEIPQKVIENSGKFIKQI
jgi:phospholipase/carboxylesterase